MRTDFLDIAIQAARASGRIQKKFLNRSFRITLKGEINLVTEVDLRCEEKIVSLIQKAFPGHDLLAEEGGKTSRVSPYRWIIDPLDGTTNYAHGYPVFCTSIALEYKGKLRVGVVFDPIRQELFTAEKGKGAFLNDQRISPSTTSELDSAFLVTGFPYHVRENRQNLEQFQRLLLHSQAVRRDGSAALDLCYTAMGRFDGFWEFALAPWDLAAGSLILKEAGGKITSIRGGPFSIYKGTVLASNGKIHAAMRKLLED